MDGATPVEGIELHAMLKHKYASILIASLAFVFDAEAATYYVSPTGSDSNNGTSQATAWQSITRVNQISSSLQPGDRILFQKGGTYR
ncbi:MAG TPA: hypothetical protein PK760_05910, partial [Flavobacteriales bacterium]|nr:hypothetical protein [Flavobacteriales bacterium]